MRVLRCALRAAPLLLALPLALAVACGRDGDEAEFDAGAVVNDAADRLEEVQSFHFVLTHRNGGTKIVSDMLMTRAEGDVVRPASLRADLEAEAGGQKLRLSVIGIETQTWLSNPFDPSAWQLLAGTDARDILNLARVPEVMREVQDVEAAGEERVSGADTYKVRATVHSGALAVVVPEAAEPGRSVEVEMWVGKEDSLVRRLVVKGPINDEDREDIERRLDLSGFDVPVIIQAPQ